LPLSLIRVEHGQYLPQSSLARVDPPVPYFAMLLTPWLRLNHNHGCARPQVLPAACLSLSLHASAGAWQQQPHAGAAQDTGPVLQDSGSRPALQHMRTVPGRAAAATAEALSYRVTVAHTHSCHNNGHPPAQACCSNCSVVQTVSGSSSGKRALLLPLQLQIAGGGRLYLRCPSSPSSHNAITIALSQQGPAAAPQQLSSKL